MILPDSVKNYIEASVDLLEDTKALFADALKYLDAQETVVLANALGEAGIDTLDAATEVLHEYMLEELNDLEEDTSYDYFLHGFPSFGLSYVDLKDLLYDTIKETTNLRTVGSFGDYYIRKG